MIDNINSIKNCSIPKVEKITPSRLKALNARLKEGFDLENIEREIMNSSFLQGKATGFKMTFDFVVNPNRYIKIIEGGYRDRENKQQQTQERSSTIKH